MNATFALLDKEVSSFSVAYNICDDGPDISGVDFSPNGKTLICSNVSKIRVYDCLQEKEAITTIKTSKYGSSLVRYAYSEEMAIHASTLVDHDIRYFSINQNKYVQYFTGHTDYVMELCVSRVKKLILSASRDKTIRLWDTRTPGCLAVMNMDGLPIAAYDPLDGHKFAATYDSESIKLYDLRQFKGSFKEICINEFVSGEAINWTGLKYSPNGTTILMSTDASIMKLVDVSSGNVLQTITATGLGDHAGFSPDSKYIISGSIDGLVHIWNTQTRQKVCELKSEHPGSVKYAFFNPEYDMLATAESFMSFWYQKH